MVLQPAPLDLYLDHTILGFTCDIGQQFHGDRAFYYKGPWSVFYRGREVGHGEIMCFNKRQVASEIQRQLHFWCVEYLDE